MPLAVPAEITWIVGNDVTASQLNSNLRDAINYLIGPPIATVYQTASQAMSSTANTPTAISFDSSAVDSYSGHSGSVNPSRYIGQVSGWYLVCGAIVYVPSGSGTYRKAQVYKNGTSIPYATGQLSPVNSASFATVASVPPTIVFLNGTGDYVELWGSCDVANLGTTPNTSNESFMTVFWLHS